jgi:hypothetical protein
MELGQSIAESRPKTLPCRFGIADRFDREAAEIHSLGNALESAKLAVAPTGEVGRN